MALTTNKYAVEIPLSSVTPEFSQLVKEKGWAVRQCRKPVDGVHQLVLRSDPSSLATAQSILNTLEAKGIAATLLPLGDQR